MGEAKRRRKREAEQQRACATETAGQGQPPEPYAHMSVWDDPEEEARLAEIAEHKARVARLAARYGTPEYVDAADALALAVTALVPVDPDVTAGDVYASAYRDDAAADAYLESNRVHNGHPALAKVPMPDGRVVGILDLRPALERARREAAEET